jgi:hypothetical protein
MSEVDTSSPYIIRNMTLRSPGVVVIDYVQGSNYIPIMVNIVDYTVPSNSKANLYIEKPSGKIIYNAVTISGNTLIITPTVQMFAEYGEQIGTVEILDPTNKVLATFPITFHVAKNETNHENLMSLSESDIITLEAEKVFNDRLTNAEKVYDQRLTKAEQTVSNYANSASNYANAASKSATDAQRYSEIAQAASGVSIAVISDEQIDQICV